MQWLVLGTTVEPLVGGVKSHYLLSLHGHQNLAYLNSSHTKGMEDSCLLGVKEELRDPLGRQMLFHTHWASLGGGSTKVHRSSGRVRHSRSHAPEDREAGTQPLGGKGGSVAIKVRIMVPDLRPCPRPEGVGAGNRALTK